MKNTIQNLAKALQKARQGTDTLIIPKSQKKKAITDW